MIVNFQVIEKALTQKGFQPTGLNSVKMSQWWDYNLHFHTGEALGLVVYDCGNVVAYVNSDEIKRKFIHGPLIENKIIQWFLSLQS